MCIRDRSGRLWARNNSSFSISSFRTVFISPVRRSFKAPKGALAMCSATMQRTLNSAPYAPLWAATPEQPNNAKRRVKMCIRDRASFDVLTPQPGEVFYDDAVDVAIGDILHHFLECLAVKDDAAVSIVDLFGNCLLYTSICLRVGISGLRSDRTCCGFFGNRFFKLNRFL